MEKFYRVDPDLIKDYLSKNRSKTIEISEKCCLPVQVLNKMRSKPIDQPHDNIYRFMQYLGSKATEIVKDCTGKNEPVDIVIIDGYNFMPINPPCCILVSKTYVITQINLPKGTLSGLQRTL